MRRVAAGHNRRRPQDLLSRENTWGIDSAVLRRTLSKYYLAHCCSPAFDTRFIAWSGLKFRTATAGNEAGRARNTWTTKLGKMKNTCRLRFLLDFRFIRVLKTSQRIAACYVVQQRRISVVGTSTFLAGIWQETRQDDITTSVSVWLCVCY